MEKKSITDLTAAELEDFAQKIISGRINPFRAGCDTPYDVEEQDALIARFQELKKE